MKLIKTSINSDTFELTENNKIKILHRDEIYRIFLQLNDKVSEPLIFKSKDSFQKFLIFMEKCNISSICDDEFNGCKMSDITTGDIGAVCGKSLKTKDMEVITNKAFYFPHISQYLNLKYCILY